LLSKIILIGAGDDFTKEEVKLALKHHFIAVTPALPVSGQKPQGC
jgi:hypothetical protein